MKNWKLYAALLIVFAAGSAYYYFHRAPKAVVRVISAPPEEPLPAKDTASSPQSARDTGLSHAEAVNLFRGRLIQFDADCTVTPGSSSFKNGTAVMFDNRAPVDRDFSLDGMRYHLKAHEFKVLALSSAGLPHTIMIDCGKGVNNAGITLQ